MPRIIDYSRVVDRMQGEGMVCNYHNSGAFGFPPGTEAHTLAWIGPPDETIRPAARALTRRVAEPYEPNLASLATRAWQQRLGGEMWIMPMSHWAYELDFGSPDWMPALLQTIGIDSMELRPRTNAAAIEFSPDEAAPMRLFLQGLLTHLVGSDFMMAFPGRPVVCMIHHHKQLWWTSGDRRLVGDLEKLLESLGDVR